jgi:hypothetical protein
MITSRIDHHRKHYHDRVCSVDPISLGIGAIAGIAGGLFGGGGNDAPAPATPQAPAPQAPPQKTPQVKPQSNNASTFIGGVPAPPQNTGQKTLLGQ